MEFHKLACHGNEMSITHKKPFDRIFVFEFCQSNFYRLLFLPLRMVEWRLLRHELKW